MPKQSKWQNRLQPLTNLVPGDLATPRVARLTLSHDDDLQDEHCINIALDPELAPLVGRYTWRWDARPQWVFADIPADHATLLRITGTRLYLHKYVAIVKRPFRNTTVGRCDKPADYGDLRFSRIKNDIRYDTPKTERFEKIEKRIALSDAVRNAFEMCKDTMSLDTFANIATALGEEARREKIGYDMACAEMEPVGENGVIDDVALHQLEIERTALQTEDDTESDDE